MKIKLKGLYFADVAEIQEAITDEFKKVQKEKFSVDFQKVYDHTKPAYMPMELILNLKSYVPSSYVFNLKKKSFLTFWIELCIIEFRRVFCQDYF
jgi:hypothetical protein